MAEAAAEQGELFHDAERAAYATIPVGDHSETWPIRSTSFRHWVTQLLFEADGGLKAPSGQAVLDAVRTCEAMAIYRGPLKPVFLRVAPLDDGIVIDLANDRWEVIHVTRNGWTVMTAAPVRFIRSGGMLALPYPERGGTIDDLRPFLNTANEDAWRLVIAWLVMAFRPRGPYPILALSGVQGAAKTTAGRILRALIDPDKVPDRTIPRDERDLAISARNGWVTNLDNLSAMPDWLSDGLARLSTGAGLTTRQLYTDSEEIRFYAQRPALINGITEVITRGDLLDRAILVELAAVAGSTRRRDADLWGAFEEARPSILGALLDAVSVALQRESSVKLSSYPRMADFAQWIVAAEPGLGWPEGSFLSAYYGNRSSVHELALEVSPVAAAVREFMDARKGEPWEGIATRLLDLLTGSVGEEVSRRKSWPTAAKVLADHLRRLTPNLRAVGVDIEFARDMHRRVIRLSTHDPDGYPASSSSWPRSHDEARPSHDAHDAGIQPEDDHGMAIEVPVLSIACTDYGRHGAVHRWVGDAWICELCDGPTGAPA